MVRLLSDNDLKYLHKALETGAIVTLERQYKGYEIIAKTRAVGYPWMVDTIMQGLVRTIKATRFSPCRFFFSLCPAKCRRIVHRREGG